MHCIFCAIIKGEIDSAKVYEDEQIIAFLDVNPVSKGHCLVVPKQHSESIFDISEESLQKVTLLAKTLSQRITHSLNAQGINIIQSSGAQAGQVVFHFHLHLIPRYENDVIGHPFEGVKKEQPDLLDLKKIAETISK